jgi:N-acetylmuramoyl-L-alanine amidase
MKIKGVIDPGHGGYSNWNVGYSGKYYEHIGMLELSKLIQQKLNATGKFDIKLTRDTDIYLELWERAQVAVDFDAEFFISEHTNAPSVSARGGECFYSVDLPKDKAFAERLSADLANTFNIPNRGAKICTDSSGTEDYYGVMDYAQDNGVPHVWLVENMFHSNPIEEQILLTQMDKIAEITAKNICIEFGVEYKEGDVEEMISGIVIMESIGDLSSAMLLQYKFGYGIIEKPFVKNDELKSYKKIIKVGGVEVPSVPTSEVILLSGVDRVETNKKVLEFIEFNK